MDKRKKKSLIRTYVVLYIIVALFVSQVMGVYKEGYDIFEWYEDYMKFIDLNGYLHIKFNGIHTIKGLLISAIICIFYALFDYMDKSRKFMHGKEHGQAKWADVESVTDKFADKKNPNHNRIYSEHLRIGMDGDVTRINNNSFIIGGSGAGKSFFELTPNVYQANPNSKFPGSYVFTDPKGELLQKNGKFFQTRNYVVKVLNLTSEGMSESDGFNPFKYIRKELDIDKLLTNIVDNTTDETATKGDPFWEKAEIMLLKSLFLFVWMEGDRYGYKKNIPTVIDLLDLAEVSDDSCDTSELDEIFERLARDTEGEKGKGKRHPAYRKYKKVMRGAADTIRSIIISANARMEIFDTPDVRRLLEEDELDLGSIGSGLVDGKKNVKTALFCIIPDSDSTYNCIAAMMYTLLSQELYAIADDKKNKGKLPVPVTLWLDEFPNIVMPKNFLKLLATMRSRLLSAVIIIQNLAQLKKMYEKDWEVIPGNCDVLVYLGGNEQSTFEYISKNLGKCTIWKRSVGESFSTNSSSSKNEDTIGRELMTPDEVRELDNDKCIIFVRGQKPILDYKFKTMNSPHFTESNKLGIYDHTEEKNKRMEIFPISKSEFNHLEKKGKTLTVELNAKDVEQHGVGSLEVTDDELLELAEHQEERRDIEEFDDEIEIDISDLSIEEILCIDDFELEEDELAEVVEAISNGLTDDEIKSFILYGNAKRMRAKRMTLEAFAKRRALKQQQG